MVEKRSMGGVPGGHNQGMLPGSFFIYKILKYSKTDKKYFADFSESVYLPYHVPPYFLDSGVFRKDSFMSSSGVTVWIILLSILIGVPEI